MRKTDNQVERVKEIHGKCGEDALDRAKWTNDIQYSMMTSRLIRHNHIKTIRLPDSQTDGNMQHTRNDIIQSQPTFYEYQVQNNDLYI